MVVNHVCIKTEPRTSVRGNPGRNDGMGSWELNPLFQRECADSVNQGISVLAITPCISNSVNSERDKISGVSECCTAKTVAARAGGAPGPPSRGDAGPPAPAPAPRGNRRVGGHLAAAPGQGAARAFSAPTTSRGAPRSCLCGLGFAFSGAAPLALVTFPPTFSPPPPPSGPVTPSPTDPPANSAVQAASRGVI